MNRPPNRPFLRGESTREDLIRAAATEFNERGYEGTNTNLIARRAGYAPQTFYRHFADKQAIFLVCYERWVEEEFETVSHINSVEEVAAAVVAHHKRNLPFRRSLAALTRSDPAVAAARAASREAQLRVISARAGSGPQKKSLAEHLAQLLIVERLADGLAEGEFAALGVSDGEALALLANALQELSGSTRK